MNNTIDTNNIDLNPPLFPNGWNGLDLHGKRQSQFFGDYRSSKMYELVGTNDELNNHKKEVSAKIAFHQICDKMESEIEKKKKINEEFDEDSDIYESDESDYMKDTLPEVITPKYHYEYTTMNTWLSSIRYNLIFDSGFAMAHTSLKEIDKSCVCPCSTTAKFWRKEFKIDFMKGNDICKGQQLYSPSGLLQHLKKKGNEQSFLHLATYYYLSTLYSDQSQFFKVPKKKSNKKKNKTNLGSKFDKYPNPFDQERNTYKDQRLCRKPKSYDLYNNPVNRVLPRQSNRLLDKQTKSNPENKRDHVVGKSDVPNKQVMHQKSKQNKTLLDMSNEVVDYQESLHVNENSPKYDNNKRRTDNDLNQKTTQTTVVEQPEKPIETIVPDQNQIVDSSKDIIIDEKLTDNVLNKTTTHQTVVNITTKHNLDNVMQQKGKKTPYIISKPRPVQRYVNGKNVVFETRTTHNFKYEGPFKIVFRTNREVNTNPCRTRNRRRRNAKVSKAIERNEFFDRGLTPALFSGTIVKFNCDATQQLRQGSIHCIGRNSLYQWKISVLKPQCDLFLNTQELLEITARDGTPEKPWYNIFIGEVSFSDLIYQNDQEANEIQNPSNA